MAVDTPTTFWLMIKFLVFFFYNKIKYNVSPSFFKVFLDALIVIILPRSWCWFLCIFFFKEEKKTWRSTAYDVWRNKTSTTKSNWVWHITLVRGRVELFFGDWCWDGREDAATVGASSSAGYCSSETLTKREIERLSRPRVVSAQGFSHRFVV